MPEPFENAVREWMADAVCSDCGHLRINHDCGWCYSCARAERPCEGIRHLPESADV